MLVPKPMLTEFGIHYRLWCKYLDLRLFGSPEAGMTDLLEGNGQGDDVTGPDGEGAGTPGHAHRTPAAPAP